MLDLGVSLLEHHVAHLAGYPRLEHSLAVLKQLLSRGEAQGTLWTLVLTVCGKGFQHGPGLLLQGAHLFLALEDHLGRCFLHSIDVHTRLHGLGLRGTPDGTRLLHGLRTRGMLAGMQQLLLQALEHLVAHKTLPVVKVEWAAVGHTRV